MTPRRYGPLAYVPITRRPKLAWPDGARVALWVNPNIEFFGLDDVMPGNQNERVPRDRAQIPNVRNWAVRDYGNRVGIWRIMEVLTRHGIRASDIWTWTASGGQAVLASASVPGRPGARSLGRAVGGQPSGARVEPAVQRCRAVRRRRGTSAGAVQCHRDGGRRLIKRAARPHRAHASCEEIQMPFSETRDGVRLAY